MLAVVPRLPADDQAVLAPVVDKSRGPQAAIGASPPKHDHIIAA
jgi:hypothetical protein